MTHGDTVSVAEIAAILVRIPVFAGQSLDALRVERLPSLTNRTYKVTIGADSYVLRIAGAGTARYIDRANEAHNARLAASIGIAPEVLYADAASGLLLTRFIDGGIPLSNARLREPPILRSAVALLKRLHDSRLPFGGRMELLPKLAEYLALAAGRSWPSDLEPATIRRRADAAAAALARESWPPVPSHIDPVPNNFVAVAGNGTALYLLDWEYSALCEPMWDVAALSLEAELDAEQDEALLAAYFPTGAAKQAGRFMLFKALLNLLAAAWAMVQVVDGNQSADFVDFARTRLARHAAFAASPACRDYLSRFSRG